MPQLLNKNISLIWKIKLLWFTDNEYENKVQNVFAREIYVLRGNNLFDFANTFTALNPGWRVLPHCAYIQWYGLLTSVGSLI